MPIEMNCPHCGAKMRAPDDAIGKKGRCANPACKKMFIISVAPRPKDQDGTPPSFDFPEWGERPQSSPQQAGQQPPPETGTPQSPLAPGPVPEEAAPAGMPPSPSAAGPKDDSSDGTIYIPQDDSSGGTIYIPESGTPPRPFAAVTKQPSVCYS